MLKSIKYLYIIYIYYNIYKFKNIYTPTLIIPNVMPLGRYGSLTSKSLNYPNDTMIPDTFRMFIKQMKQCRCVPVSQFWGDNAITRLHYQYRM